MVGPTAMLWADLWAAIVDTMKAAQSVELTAARMAARSESTMGRHWAALSCA